MLAFSAPGSSLEKSSIATPKSTTSPASSNQSRTENPPTPPSSPDPAGRGRRMHLKFVTERLREEVLDVEAIYVNCWRNYT